MAASRGRGGRDATAQPGGADAAKTRLAQRNRLNELEPLRTQAAALAEEVTQGAASVLALLTTVALFFEPKEDAPPSTRLSGAPEGNALLDALRSDYRGYEPLLARLAGDGAVTLSREAVAALEAYDFPGNVRELENVLERALTMAGGSEIQAADLQLTGPRLGADTEVLDGPVSLSLANQSLPEKLEGIEKQSILEALEKTHFNRTAAAKLLGVSFRTLRYRMERLGIKDELDAKR